MTYIKKADHLVLQKPIPKSWFLKKFQITCTSLTFYPINFLRNFFTAYISLLKTFNSLFNKNCIKVTRD